MLNANIRHESTFVYFSTSVSLLLSASLYLLCGLYRVFCFNDVLVLEGSDSNFFLACAEVWKEPIRWSRSQHPFGNRRWSEYSWIIDDQDTHKLLEDIIALIELNQRRPRIVREARLSSTRVCRQHFVQWDDCIEIQCQYTSICKFYRNLSGRVFLSHQIVILQTAKRISW